MDTWTKQMGLPVISISFDSAKNEYSLKQKRFLADPDNKPETPSKFKYIIIYGKYHFTIIIFYFIFI